MLTVSGCQTQPRWPEANPPPDFSLIAVVQLSPADPSDEPFGATVVIEPCRTLRAAVGPGCTIRTFPEPTKTLDEAEFEKVYNLVKAIDFSATQPKPGGDQLQLIAAGNARRFQTTISLARDTNSEAGRKAKQLFEVLYELGELNSGFINPPGSYER